MKQGKRVKVIFPIEYRLLVTSLYKEREKEFVTLIGLRTFNEFTNFHYELIVDISLSGKTLEIDIRGLRAPQVTIPGSGPAVFMKEVKDLHGTYTIVVKKLSKEENIFSLHITKEKVVVKESPAKRFTDVVTTREDW